MTKSSSSGREFTCRVVLDPSMDALRAGNRTIDGAKQHCVACGSETRKVGAISAKHWRIEMELDELNTNNQCGNGR